MRMQIYNRFKVNRGLQVLLIFFVIGILAYALLIPSLGFFYDDWPFSWIVQRLGPVALSNSFQSFRPFLWPYFFLTTSVLGATPILWHIFNLFVRIGLAWVVWWSLSQIWPSQKSQVFWASILFLLFPGFSQQWVSLTHSNQELLPLLIQMLSFGLMTKGMRRPDLAKKLLPLSYGLAFIGIFSTEYFISLELLRPVVIWIILLENNKSFKERLKQTLLTWLPFLVILLLDVVWLRIYQNSSVYQSYRISIVDQFRNNPMLSSVNFLRDFIDSFTLTAVSIWAGLFTLVQNPLNALTSYLIFGLVIISFAFLWIVVRKINFDRQTETAQDRQANDHWAIQAMALGAVGIILGRLPSWAVGLPLSTDFPFDRLMMPVMLGGSLFISGLIELMIVSGARKTLLFILLGSLAVGLQFSNANSYRRDWEQQKDFFQQLIWRVPALKEGAIVLTHELPMKYVTDNSLSAALNWIYDPGNHTQQMNYMLVYSKARLDSEFLPDLNPTTKIDVNYRNLNFSSVVGNSIVLYYPTNGCLRILDARYTDKDFFPDAPYQLTDMIPLSNLNMVNVSAPAAKMPSFMGDEAAHGWCYYFQQAELARQEGDWAKIDDLYDQAKQAGLSAKTPSEYIVFMEGFYHNNKISEANQLINEKLVLHGKPVEGTCTTLARMKVDLPKLSATLDEQFNTLHCSALYSLSK